MSSRRKLHFTKLVVLPLVSLALVAPVRAAESGASGGGTYHIEPNIRTEFQFSEDHVQCKIGHAVLTDGTVFQMLMFSTSIDSVTINSTAKTVVITGKMISIVNLLFTNGTAANLSEAVPFVVFAADNGTRGAGKDFLIYLVAQPRFRGCWRLAM